MFLFLTVWLNFCGIFAHPSYFSITDMDVDAQKKTIVLSIRMFTDDLETVLHNKYNVHSWIGTESEHHDSRRLLREYVNERFSITVNNGEKIEFVTDSMVVSKEEDPMMCFYMKGVTKQTIKRIEVDNRLLTDFFSRQDNLVIINNREGYKLNRKNHTIELSL